MKVRNAAFVENYDLPVEHEVVFLEWL